MRKFYKYLIIIIILFTFPIALYLVKVNIEKKLIEKKNSIDSTWEKIVENNDRKVDFVRKNFQAYQNDSLKSIISFNKSKKTANDDYTFFLYQLNHFLINSKIDLKSRNYFIKLDRLNNQLIKKYNDEVMGFNSYASSFPIIIVARSKKYKTYDKLPLVFGETNKNPKKMKEETIEWLKDIEKREGL